MLTKLGGVEDQLLLQVGSAKVYGVLEGDV